MFIDIANANVLHPDEAVEVRHPGDSRLRKLFYFLVPCELSAFACQVLFFPSVLSNQKESFFFLRREMSYYGGTELPEPVRRLAASTIRMVPTEAFWDRSYQAKGEWRRFC